MDRLRDRVCLITGSTGIAAAAAVRCATEGGSVFVVSRTRGYVVNAIMDACYRSAKANAWAPVELEWRGGTTARIASTPETYDGQVVIKREILPDGRHKLLLRDPASGDFTDRVVAGA